VIDADKFNRSMTVSVTTSANLVLKGARYLRGVERETDTVAFRWRRIRYVAAGDR
jgi:hypothetical protein